jgi:3-hydroxyisobutyrate dehydrogenase
MATKPRVAFLGLGIMGSGMARRILQAGFPLSVYNRNPEKAKSLGAEGATVAGTPHDAAKGAQVVISMLADDNAARTVWLGDNSALSGTTRGTILIESSTVTLEWIHQLEKYAKRHHCQMLDCPVTGSKAAAASGELNFLVGGSAQTLEQARPVLEAMGKTITHLGPLGSGAMVKLINNFVCGVQLASIAEAFAMLERSGIDPHKALPVMTNGAPGSPMVKAITARILARDYTPNFHLKLMAKDLTYAMKEAEAHKLKLTTAQASLDLIQQAVAKGYGEKDIAAVVEPLRK